MCIRYKDLGRIKNKSISVEFFEDVPFIRELAMGSPAISSSREKLLELCMTPKSLFQIEPESNGTTYCEVLMAILLSEGTTSAF